MIENLDTATLLAFIISPIVMTCLATFAAACDERDMADRPWTGLGSVMPAGPMGLLWRGDESWFVLGGGGVMAAFPLDHATRVFEGSLAAASVEQQ